MGLPDIRLADVTGRRKRSRGRSARRLRRWAAFFVAGAGAGVVAALLAPVRVPRGGE